MPRLHRRSSVPTALIPHELCSGSSHLHRRLNVKRQCYGILVTDERRPSIRDVTFFVLMHSPPAITGQLRRFDGESANGEFDAMPVPIDDLPHNFGVALLADPPPLRGFSVNLEPPHVIAVGETGRKHAFIDRGRHGIRSVSTILRAHGGSQGKFCVNKWRSSVRRSSASADPLIEPRKTPFAQERRSGVGLALLVGRSRVGKGPPSG